MSGSSEPQTDPLGLLWPDDPTESGGTRPAAGRSARWVVAGPIAVIVLLAVLGQVTAPATMLVTAVAGVCLVVVLLFGDPAGGVALLPRVATVLAVLATAVACGLLALPRVEDAVNEVGSAGARQSSLAELQRTRDLSGRDLRGRTLNGIDLTGHDLSGADLRGASLRGATLVRADLTGAKVTGADLSGADLSAACLIDVALAGATTTGILAEGAVTALPVPVVAPAVTLTPGVPSASVPAGPSSPQAPAPTGAGEEDGTDACTVS